MIEVCIWVEDAQRACRSTWSSQAQSFGGAKLEISSFLVFDLPMSRVHATLLPFLYPSFQSSLPLIFGLPRPSSLRLVSSRKLTTTEFSGQPSNDLPAPSPASAVSLESLSTPTDVSASLSNSLDYSLPSFTDKCTIQVSAGAGGNGCAAFLREKFIPAGPPNGGDGGAGGNIYIQAVRGETSLHKLARRRMIRAGRGRNGMGSGKGGQRGEDVLLLVPAGTVVCEIARMTPGAHEAEADSTAGRRAKWIVHPGSSGGGNGRRTDHRLHEHPRPRLSNLAALEPAAPIALDLAEEMDKPMLLLAGAVGGLGNPHFVTRETPRPAIATRGTRGTRLTLSLELKLLADVGFVGMPNAGKSSLLRAISSSRARVADWAFTTIQPNIGTVVLDDGIGRARLEAWDDDKSNHHHAPHDDTTSGRQKTQSERRRVGISVADIPGLVEGAAEDRGLGLAFLRHVERARVLAFVVDLSHSDDAVGAVKKLWRELDMYEHGRVVKTKASEEDANRIVSWQAFGSDTRSATTAATAATTSTTTGAARAGASILRPLGGQRALAPLPPISTKPWFVVATKADLPHTQANFERLQAYLAAVAAGTVEHPSGRTTATATSTQSEPWKGELAAIPVSALRGEVDGVVEWTVKLLQRDSGGDVDVT